MVQFAAMRVESNEARETFQQLRLVLLRGLICRLCSLYYRIEAAKSELEARHSIVLIPDYTVVDGVSAGS
jgi:hypothetical protein